MRNIFYPIPAQAATILILASICLLGMSLSIIFRDHLVDPDEEGEFPVGYRSMDMLCGLFGICISICFSSLLRPSSYDYWLGNNRGNPTPELSSTDAELYSNESISTGESADQRSSTGYSDNSAQDVSVNGSSGRTFTNRLLGCLRSNSQPSDSSLSLESTENSRTTANSSSPETTEMSNISGACTRDSNSPATYFTEFESSGDGSTGAGASTEDFDSSSDEIFNIAQIFMIPNIIITKPPEDSDTSDEEVSTPKNRKITKF